MKRLTALALLAFAGAAIAANDEQRAVDAAQARWAASPHGPMLERILPPTFAPSQLPERGSPGAALVLQYCVQCHNLPNPAMHHAAKWPAIVDRMVLRMQGKGNMGTLMKDMMAGVQAPSAEETARLVAYLRKHGQRPLDPGRYPEVDAPSGQSFKLACQQCHVLPDPERYTAREWPAVVDRMAHHMQWMNRVVGSQRDPREPQLRFDEIVRFLQRYARRG